MHDRDAVFPDHMPLADAAEQQRSTADLLDGDYAAQHVGDLPLEASASDWQAQQETVPIDPELEEPD